jgi:hypothetical protein
MAPPIPGLRTPVQIRRRTPGDVLAGVGAIILLVALTVGVPIALITVVGLPLPHTVPKLSALTSQLDITAILRILSVIVWLAWIQLVWCVLVEIKAAGQPRRGQPEGPAGRRHPVARAPAGDRGAAAVHRGRRAHPRGHQPRPAPARALGLRPGDAPLR